MFALKCWRFTPPLPKEEEAEEEEEEERRRKKKKKQESARSVILKNSVSLSRRLLYLYRTGLIFARNKILTQLITNASEMKLYSAIVKSFETASPP